LQRAAIPFDETPEFRISLASQNAQQVIHRIETPLSLVKTYIPTLEDAYWRLWMGKMTDFNAISTIAYRDLLKFMRDRPRIVSSFVFPFVFIAVWIELSGHMGSMVGYSFVLYTFTGV